MRHMPHEVKRFFRGLTYLMSAALLIGCAATPEEEFKPPVFPPPPETPRFIYERTIRSSADIKELSSSERFKLFATGTREGAFGLAKPFDVAARDGKVYVSDTVQRSVLQFDVPNQSVKYIGTEGPGSLAKPLGLDIAPNGDLYVCDNTAKRVVVFDKDGNFLRAIGGEETLIRPSGVAVSPDGSRVFVVDTSGVDKEGHQVHIFNTETGERIQVVGSRGLEPGQFNLPLLAATSKDGHLYVVDGGNFRIQKFDMNGEFKLAWGKAGRKTGDFSRPKGITVDKDGNVYVVDAAFGNFQIFDPQGQLLLFIGNRGNTGGPAEYMLPAGIDIDEDGRIYVVDQFFRKIDIYRPYQLAPDQGALSRKVEPKKDKS